MKSTKLDDSIVESTPEVHAVEQQETISPNTLEPEVQPQALAQTEAKIPVGEEMKKPSEPPPKKKSAVRRLRKAIMGY
jgi:hypothetical protein